MLHGIELEQKIYADAVSESWRARQLSPTRAVLVYWLHAECFAAPAVRERLLADIRRAASLSHPHLTPLFDAGEDGRRVYAIAGWPHSPRLSERLQSGKPLPEKQALDLLFALAQALRHAAERAPGLWHGFLRPDAIAWAPHGETLLLDLGLTGVPAFLAAGGDPRELRAVLQTAPYYVAPEVARGRRDADFRADLYSLAALACHLLTGRAPFADCAPAEALDKHLFGQFPDPRETQARVSGNAVTLLETWLAKDPARRPASWEQAADDLAAVRRGGAPATPAPERGASTLRRREDTPDAAPAPQKVRAPPAVGGRDALHRARTHNMSLAVPIALVIIAGLVAAGWPHFRDWWTLLRHPPPPSILAPSPAGESPSRSALDAASRPSAGGTPGIADTRGDWLPQTGWSSEEAEQAADALAPARLPTDEQAGARLRSHPAYIRGARMFNEAVEAFERFKTVRDTAALQRVPRLSEDAAMAFEQCQRERPEDRAELDTLKQHCYRLAYAARHNLLQSGLLTGGERPGSVFNESRRGVLPDLTTRPEIVAAESAGGLKLGPAWNRPLQTGGAVIRDYSSLLAGRGRPEVDVRPQPGLRLRPGIAYLAQVEEVARAWGVPLPPGTPVPSPVFPANSFTMHEVNVAVVRDFSKTVLLADAEGHVVGLQALDDASREGLRLPEVLFSPKWAVHDWVRARQKTGDGQRIAHRLTAENGVVQIESELADFTGGARLSQTRSILWLPQPVVNLMLSRLPPRF